MWQTHIAGICYVEAARVIHRSVEATGQTEAEGRGSTGETGVALKEGAVG